MKNRGKSKQAELNRALLAVVGAGDLARVRQTVADGADPRCDNDEPVCRAAAARDLAVLRYLIEECGADAAARDGFPLVTAIFAGDLPLVQYLVGERGVSLVCGDADDVEDHAFYVAATEGELAIVRYLIEERGADPHMGGDACVSGAAWRGHVPVVRYFIEAHGVDPCAQDSWLLRAAAGGGPDMVRYLVEERGADPRARNDEALVAAVEAGDLKVVEYLAGRIFDPVLWRGRDRAAIEVGARAIAERLRATVAFPEDRAVAAIAVVERRALRTVFELKAEAARAIPLRSHPPAPPRPL
jgi:hypothetical protein